MMLSSIASFLLVASVTSFQSTPITSRTRSILLHNFHLLNAATTLDIGKESSTEQSIDDGIKSISENEPKEDDQFHWDANWYPLVPIEFLDPSKLVNMC